MSAWDLDRRRFLRLGGVAAAGVTLPALLAACGSGGSSSGGGSTTGALRVSMPADVKSLDPQKQGDIPSMSVASNIFDTLTTRDANNNLVGGIATKWVAVDANTWRFTIRPGVKFHNGEPCDAAAVAFSINRLVNPATKSPIVELVYVKSAKVVDDHTVDFVMSASDPIIPEKVSLFGGVVVPPKYLAQKGDAGFAAAPVGTGPFKFQSRQQDNQIVMTGNPDYWGTKTQIKTLTIKIMPTPATAIAALQSGEIDIATGISPDAIAQLGDNSGASAHKVPGVREYYVAMNTLTGGPLANTNVRLAMNHAVDVPTLINTVLGGAAQRTPSLLPQQVFGFDPSLQPFDYNPDKAKSLLAQAGFPNGFSTQLSASTVDQDVTQAVAGQLAKVGIKCNVNIVDATQFKSLLVSGDPHAMGPMYLSGNTGWTLDGESFLQSTIRSNRRQSLWHDAQADSLIDVEETSLTPDARKQAFNQLQQLMATNAPFVYLYHASNVYAVRDGVDWTMPINGVLAMASAKVS
ncbi:MAG TPA: ABC transporter substrate-binding protein [Pseudonocardiaceae bacterium]|jgi:peptide/nickel transport system substrate-binding protein|nr:ABC transporter substrate-binding protein [Pseudonocardiaceae bacterium]